MAAGRHNLTRRALLGAAAGVPLAAFAPACEAGTIPFGLSLSKPFPSLIPGEEGKTALRQAQGERGMEGKAQSPFSRALAAYRRAEARVAAFKAEEALLPEERRAFPCEDLEEEFGRLDGLRLAALRRLLRVPAPDLAALALKLDLAVADLAWELEGCETCFAALQADAGGLAHRG